MGVKPNQMPSKNSSTNIHKTVVNLRTPEGFQKTYQQNHLVVYRFIYGLHGGPTEDVEDLTTTTFLRAWKARHRFQGDQGAALGWLLKIARNLVIDSQRRRGRRENPVDIETQILSSKDLTPEEHVFQQEQVSILWNLLVQLPNHHREIITLRYLLGWKVKDIAKHLGKKENSISVTIRRIIKKLQTEWPNP
jgi:RNA polymerase sigma-70 factor (ECF subfamily)